MGAPGDIPHRSLSPANHPPLCINYSAQVAFTPTYVGKNKSK